MYDWALLPPGSLVLLLVLAAVLRRPRPRLSRALVVAASLLLYVASTPLSASLLLGALQVYPSPSDDDIAAFRGEAIVVLAAGRRLVAPEYGGETVDSLTLERIRHAARLERRLGLPLFATGGDPGNQGTSLAALMREALATDFGVSVAAIEDGSRSTAENAELLARLLRDRNIGRVLLVTHSWHMPRAKRAFERQGLAVLAAPTSFVSTDADWAISDFLPAASALEGTSYALHEILGYAWYELRDGSP